ncbi:hypothetical protein B0H14DRAFT_3437015 [Mycena olivaceomarginata]|nr:hypothetical protein B0H14DRAFT_3437015 [Mycena olivaceomarginata]
MASGALNRSSWPLYTAEQELPRIPLDRRGKLYIGLLRGGVVHPPRLFALRPSRSRCRDPRVISASRRCVAERSADCRPSSLVRLHPTHTFVLSPLVVERLIDGYVIFSLFAPPPPTPSPTSSLTSIPETSSSTSPSPSSTPTRSSPCSTPARRTPAASNAGVDAVSHSVAYPYPEGRRRRLGRRAPRRRRHAARPVALALGLFRALRLR